jgi:4-hydroxythreonine-4-phosphate dehydrogenase
MKPRIGIVPGDPCGVGPELIARLLADSELCARADLLLVGDPWVLERGAQAAGVACPLRVAQRVEDLPPAGDTGEGAPPLLDVASVRPGQIRVGEASAAAGEAVLTALGAALDLERDGRLDAILFAPLNKQAMAMTGYGFGDELHWFAHRLGHDGPIGEFNVLDGLWTTRVTSHVPLKDVVGLITRDSVLQAVRFVDEALRRAGREVPRISVAALNPHAGDGGLFGREEIDVIAPAVEAARAEGLIVDGPWPADTVFLRGRDGECDAVVTMYHDQGQIAMKLMGFDRGVTVQGGLSVPITTPAHGTAFDIAGKGVASPEATRRAFALACDMAEARRAGRARAATRELVDP